MLDIETIKYCFNKFDFVEALTICHFIITYSISTNININRGKNIIKELVSEIRKRVNIVKLKKLILDLDFVDNFFIEVFIPLFVFMDNKLSPMIMINSINRFQSCIYLSTLINFINKFKMSL